MEYTNIAQYNEGIVSDHRALIMDINVKKLQEGDLTNWERKERNLNPGIKRHRQEMVKRIFEISKERGWSERIEKIGKERPSVEGENRLDRIDKEITKTMLKQEKEIAKQKKRPKTKKLNRAILNHLLWKIAMSAIRNKRDFSERLNEIARKIKRKEDDEQWNDVKTVTIELRKARKERRNLERQVKEELKEERETNFVENLPSFSDPEQEKKKKRAIEKQKRQFRQIKESLRKKSTGCITHIVVPEPERKYPYKPEEVAEWR